MADVTPVPPAPPPTPDTPRRYTADEAASALRISRTQVYRLMDEGIIESVRIGHRRFVVWDSVIKLLTPNGAL